VGSVSMPAREIYRLQDEVWREWQELPTTEEGIPEILQGLRDNRCKVIIATSRPVRSASLVIKWLKKQALSTTHFIR
jgi:phosphoglycolate phosphatase-like HAD superfamily hydrolase